MNEQINNSIKSIKQQDSFGQYNSSLKRASFKLIPNLNNSSLKQTPDRRPGAGLNPITPMKFDCVN